MSSDPQATVDGASATPEPSVTVVYIGGDSRSGSTLLDLILDRIPGFVAVGELNYIWERGLLKNELCGCGSPFSDCAFWQRVGQEGFGGWEHVDLPEMLRLEQSVTRLRHWPRLIAPRLRRGFSKEAVTYAEQMQRLYVAISSVSGCPVVVDSSKNPCVALLLRVMPNVRPRIVHMVRDSRGVAFSWTRHVLRSEATAESAEYMPTFRPWQSGVVWTVKNLQHDVMKARGIQQLFLSYESLVRSTRSEVERLLRYADASVAERDLAFLDHDPIAFGENHTVSGNPLRFRRGEVSLRLDDEWRSAMRRRTRLLVLSLTWPHLLAYGYLGRGRQRTSPSRARLPLLRGGGDSS